MAVQSTLASAPFVLCKQSGGWKFGGRFLSSSHSAGGLTARSTGVRLNTSDSFSISPPPPTNKTPCVFCAYAPDMSPDGRARSAISVLGNLIAGRPGDGRAAAADLLLDACGEITKRLCGLTPRAHTRCQDNL